MKADADIFVVTGTTAVGKTETALRWAEEHDAEIVSCDSTNVYRGIDVGTAKPTREERARVPHHGIDLVSPREKFSVADYLAFAVPCVRALAARGKKILVAGGSGFYLKAFYAPVVDGIDVPESVRARVAALVAAGNDAAVAALRELNPDGAPGFDWRNPCRVVRALERCLASGKTISALRREMEARTSPFSGYKIRTLLLRRSREDLNGRIDRRVRAMLDAGLVDEVRALAARGELLPDTPAGKAIGYRETLAWLASGEPGGVPALAETIALSTRQLAAGQRKWFRTQIPVDEIRDLS